MAVEFGLDRRTVAARLRGVSPAGKIAGGHDGWRLSDVVPVLASAAGQNGSTSQGSFADAELIGAPFSASGTLVDEAMCAMAVMLVDRMPAQIASLAVVAGAPMAVAYTLWGLATLRVMMLADELLAGVGIRWRCEDHFPPLNEPDWNALADRAGEKVDRRAWRRHLKARSDAKA